MNTTHQQEKSQTDTSACPFCRIIHGHDAERIRHQSEHGIVIRDGFQVSAGHTLVIPKRHIPSFFDLTGFERTDLMALLDWAKADVEGEFKPDAFNIGINDGPAAGQTVPHLHIHLIPRYWEEGVDPRGGVRWVIPKKANYWNKDPDQQ